ncbi:TniB family NTP-binding protein [Oceanisphaera pacifica]|uniref:TniB family NTP-binding protein n=1 Tax=Oceanisphaera pacifica TaxID=2818389 RepID=A0ABS3NFN7_9GAMM|nr:TniB family NTP-binding protein [Oceanisphaera pacifica]
MSEIYDDFNRLRYNHRLGGEQQCMLITGDTGCGKSLLVKNYQRQFSGVEEMCGGYPYRPLLISRIPSKPTLSATIIELLKDLGQASSIYRKGRSSDLSLTEALIKCLVRCKTELIIIDEFQELVEFKSGEKRSEIANRLKLISEKARVPIVLVGMPWAEKITEDPQWASRLMTRRLLPYFKLSEDPENFIRFLMGLAKKMPFTELPKLEKQHTVFALFSACGGCLRTLKHLLDEAVKQALLADAQTLTSEHLSKSFSLFEPTKVNPFLQKLEELQAREVKHYSRYNSGASYAEDALIPTQFGERVPISMLIKKS